MHDRSDSLADSIRAIRKTEEILRVRGELLKSIDVDLQKTRRAIEATRRRLTDFAYLRFTELPAKP